jgi:hypothetical protein
MAEEEVRIVVARARIEHAPEIEAVAPREVRVKANKPLRVQYLYHVDEVSKAQEEWKFMLQSNVGESQKGPIQSKWADRWGLPDRFWGTLEQTFQFEKPGTYPADFKVNAEYDRSPWRKKTGGFEARKELRGNFIVQVEP